MQTVRAAIVVAFFSATLVSRANAEVYPSKPIKIVVPAAAGGSADQRARLLAEKVSKAIGQPIIVENRPGASGAIGAAVVAKAVPDGYTLLWGTTYDLAINPAVNRALPYDPLRDFAPITRAVASHLVLSTIPSLGVKSFKALIALAKSKPGKLICGSAGNATAGHFALEVLSRIAHVEITHVAFKGDAPLLTDMIGGHVDMGFTVTTPAMPYIASGKIVPLLVSSHERLSALKDVPTANELGALELEMILWGGVLAPAGTPQPIINRLNSEFTKAINSAEVRTQWTSGGAHAISSTPQEFGAFINEEMNRWATVIRQSSVSLQ